MDAEHESQAQQAFPRSPATGRRDPYGLKLALYNEQQLRAWHEDTGRGPSDHYLLRPDPVDWGHIDLTKAQAQAMDAERIAALHQGADLDKAA